MAKPNDKKTEEGKAAKPSIMAVLLPVLVLTLIAGGGGFAVATVLKSRTSPPPAADGAAKETVKEGDAALPPGNEGNGGLIKQLAPIITNLASPKDTWMRLEVSLVVKPEAQAELDMLAVKSSDALLTMLRTVNLAQIEGPSGFLHFKEDINDLLRVNSENKVAQVLINSMVVE